MIVVSSRIFRANQSHYFDMAKIQDVVIVSRNKGSFRLMPIKDDDTLLSKEELYAKIDQGLLEHQANKGLTMEENESGEDFINRILCNTK